MQEEKIRRRKGKSKGTLRLCVDYRALNSITVKNRAPLPRIDNLLIQIQEATCFSKLDLRNGYHLIRIAEGHEWKTAFRTRYGLFQYKVMPFGLANCPAVFQSFMNETFHDMIDIFVVIYIDDLLIYSKSLEEHVNHVKLVLERLKHNNLFVKLEKCLFHSKAVEFLGFEISDKGINMVQSKVQNIIEWPIPENLKQLQSFLGFINFYSRFIQNYSKLVNPLYRFSKKTQKFEWLDSDTSTFEAIKEAIKKATLLRHYDSTKEVILYSDASDYALGATLLQKFEAGLQPIAFWSRKLTPAEINYDVHDKELLAVKASLEHWRHYCIGTSISVKVYSDHKNLEWFMSTKTLSRRQARWAMSLADYNFQIIYHAGTENYLADALSRRADYALSETEKSSTQARTILTPSHFQMIGHIKTKLKTVDDSAVQVEILSSRHDGQSAGHFGFRKTLELIQRDYTWPNIRKDVRDYILSCPLCSRAKVPRNRTIGLLQPLETPRRPWAHISLDFITDLPLSEGSDAILVIVDSLTKMAHFIPCNKSCSSADLAKTFIPNVFRLHGIPDKIVSDRGPQFISKMWKRFCELAGIKTALSTAFHPQTDGQTERVNQTLETILRIYCNYQQNNWKELLPIAEFAYNNSMHSSIKCSPFYANYGFNPRMDLLECSTSVNPDAESRIKKLQEEREKMKTLLDNSKLIYKRFYDRKKGSIAKFKKGDYVFIKSTNIKINRTCKKLDFKYIGPFQINEVIGELNYKLDLPTSMKIHPTFHVSLLKAVTENRFPNRCIPPPLPIIIDNEVEYEVESILDKKIIRNQVYYLVKWKGYGEHEASWEPLINLTHSQEIIREFEKASS